MVGCQPESRHLSRIHPSLLWQPTTRVQGIARQALLAIVDFECLDRDEIAKRSNNEVVRSARSDAGRELVRAARRCVVIRKCCGPCPAQMVIRRHLFGIFSSRIRTRNTHLTVGAGIQPRGPRSLFLSFYCHEASRGAVRHQTFVSRFRRTIQARRSLPSVHFHTSKRLAHIVMSYHSATTLVCLLEGGTRVRALAFVCGVSLQELSRNKPDALQHP